MDEIYLKIYLENDDTIVFEGQGKEDKPGYYPTRWDDTAKRLGTVVIGRKHITITRDAIAAFRKIVEKAHHTGDDLSCLSCLDIRACYSIQKDGTRSDTDDDVCVSYLGDIVTRWNIDEVIQDDGFFIGTVEGMPETHLLDTLTIV